MNRVCINAIALWDRWARGCADVRCITNRQYGDLKSEGGGDDLRMCHWLTTMPRPREIEVDGGQYRRIGDCVTRESGQARKRAARLGTLDASGPRGGEDQWNHFREYDRPPMTRPQ